MIDVDQRSAAVRSLTLIKSRRRRNVRKLTAGCSAVLIVSCLIGDAEAQPTDQAAEYCVGYAREYARNGSRQGQVLRGGAIGSLIGLGIGSIGGAAGAGAAIGAGIGAIGGGVRRAKDADQLFIQAYDDCIARTVR
jgi:hypothetical protein